ncbi:leukocidin family pore-forming toxin (plasmid) [Clostridium perfringens]
MGIMAISKRKCVKSLSICFLALIGVFGQTVTTKAYTTGNEININSTKSTSNLNLNIVFGKDSNLQQNVAQVKIKGTSIMGGLYKMAPFNIIEKEHVGNLSSSYTYEAQQRYDFPTSYYVSFDVDQNAHFGSFAPSQETDSATVTDTYSSSIGFNLGYPLSGGGNISITNGQNVSYKQDAYKTLLDLKTSNHLGWKIKFNKFYNNSLGKLVDLNDKDMFLSTRVGHKGRYDNQIDMLLNYDQVPSTMRQLVPKMATEIISNKNQKESIFTINLQRNTASYHHSRNNHRNSAWDGGAYDIYSTIQQDSAVAKDVYKVKINWEKGTAEFID